VLGDAPRLAVELRDRAADVLIRIGAVADDQPVVVFQERHVIALELAVIEGFMKPIDEAITRLLHVLGGQGSGVAPEDRRANGTARLDAGLRLLDDELQPGQEAEDVFPVRLEPSRHALKGGINAVQLRAGRQGVMRPFAKALCEQTSLSCAVALYVAHFERGGFMDSLLREFELPLGRPGPERAMSRGPRSKPRDT
jgi:hypothetical protein